MTYLSAFPEEKYDKNSEQYFEWPKQADLVNLKLTEPLILKSVRTKSMYSWISSIQFVFNNGIESPFIKGSQSGYISQVELSGTKIGKIVPSHDNSDTGIIKFVHENGSQVIFSHYNAKHSSTLIVPESHYIVGFYGMINFEKLKNLGFILAKF